MERLKIGENALLVNILIPEQMTVMISAQQVVRTHAQFRNARITANAMRIHIR
jgi:hypothetical protein